MSVRHLCIAIAPFLVVIGVAEFPSKSSPVADSLGYQLPRSFTVGATARLVIHADLNGDGKEDLILVGETSHLRERGVQILEGNGDGTFRQGITVELQNPTRAMVVADINGDGRPDLILLHPGVAILLNTTPGPGAPVSFGAEQGLGGGFGPALAAADLNGDGKAEVLLGTTPTRDASDEQGTLRIVSAPPFTDPNHNSGSASALDIPVPGIPVSVVVSDFDGDGKPDIAVVFTGPRHEPRAGVAVFMNRTPSSISAMQFARPTVVDFDHPVDFAVSADLDGDGRNDLFAAWCSGRDQPCGAVSLLNKAAPQAGIQFMPRSVPLSVRGASNWILQDINHDGKPDLLFLNRQQGVTFPLQAPGEVVFALGLGDGRFAAPRTFSASSANPPESLILGFVPTVLVPCSSHVATAGFVVVTDSPQSGFPAASSRGRTAQIFAGKSLDPPFSPLSTITGIPPGAFAVGDLNGDGRSEMVVVTPSDILVYSLLGKAQNRPVQVKTLPRSWNRFAPAPQRAILEDLNGDGKLDLIVGNGYDTNLEVYVNTSDGKFSFAPPVSLPWCPKGFSPPMLKALVNLSIELASADINGDGKADLVSSGRCGLNVLLNRTPDRGVIAFDSPVSAWGAKQPLGWQSGVFALADLNRDGKVDIVVGENSYTPTGEISALDVLMNETISAPTFRVAQRLQLGKRLAGIGSGDFNHDGWLDIATLDTDGTLRLLLNGGPSKGGAFAARQEFTVMPNPQQLLLINRPGGSLPRLVLRNQDSVAVIQ